MRSEEEIFQILNEQLHSLNPKIITSRWILQNVPIVYRYLQKNFRARAGGIDWDMVTREMDRCFHARWQMPSKHQPRVAVDIEYGNLQAEIRDKLYVFVTRLTAHDKLMHDLIAIRLARLAQRGCVSARKQLVDLMYITASEWIECDARIARWRGYEERISSTIDRCIEGYRYSGTFVGYVYCTMECMGRGLILLEAWSLNQVGEDGSELIGRRF